MSRRIRTREHSSLCLFAIYVIQIFFHVLTPVRLSVSKATLSSEFDLILSERSMNVTERNNVESVNSLIVNANDVEEKNVGITFERAKDKNVNSMGNITGQFSYQVPRQSWNCSGFGRSSHENWILTTVRYQHQTNESRLSDSTNKIDSLLNRTFSNLRSRNASQIATHENLEEEERENSAVLLLVRVMHRALSHLIRIVIDYETLLRIDEFNNVKLASSTSNDPTVSTAYLQTENIREIECYIADWNSILPTENEGDVINNALLYIVVPIVDHQNACRTFYPIHVEIQKDVIRAVHTAKNGNTCKDKSIVEIVCKNILRRTTYQDYPEDYLDVLYKTWSEKKMNETTSRITTEESLNSTTWGIFFGCLAFLLTFTEGQGRPGNTT